MNYASDELLPAIDPLASYNACYRLNSFVDKVRAKTTYFGTYLSKLYQFLLLNDKAASYGQWLRRSKSNVNLSQLSVMNQKSLPIKHQRLQFPVDHSLLVAGAFGPRSILLATDHQQPLEYRTIAICLTLRLQELELCIAKSENGILKLPKIGKV